MLRSMAGSRDGQIVSDIQRKQLIDRVERCDASVSDNVPKPKAARRRPRLGPLELFGTRVHNVVALHTLSGDGD